MSSWSAVFRSLETRLKSFLDKLSVVSAEMRDTLLEEVEESLIL